MTSKNLFFNIMREDFKRRLWAVALILLFFFFAFPVSAAMMISDYLKDMEAVALGSTFTTAGELKLELLEKVTKWMSVENGLVVTFIIVFAVVCGATGFSYLHSKQKTDFFHSIPVKREKLFAASFVNGILYTAAPYLVCLTLAAVMVQLKTGVILPWGEVFGTYFFQMAFYIMIYATVVLAVILTGNTIVSLLGVMVFCSWGPLLVGVLSAYCQEYFKTYYFNSNLMEQLLVKSSPVAWYIHSITMGRSLSGAFSALSIALILCLLSVFLYRIRPSEAAGKAMAFKKSEAIIKFLIVVPMALFGSLAFRQMRSGEDLWSIFGLVCGCIITYCIIEIIYNFDFRRLFSHKIQLIICGVVSLAILLFFRFDLSGYDTYIPAKDAVESSAIYSYDLDGDALYHYQGTPQLTEERSGQHYLSISKRSSIDYLGEMQLKNTEDVLFLARAGINFSKISEEERNKFDQTSEDIWGYTGVDVKYHLKNGRNIYRSYQVPLQETEEQMGRIYNTPEYKMTTYPVLKAADLTDYAGVNFEECDDYRHVNFPDESKKSALIAAYQEELSALTYEVRKTESPIASLQFKTRELQEMIDILRVEGNSYTRFNNWGYYPIYPSFTKTIALLKECGINPGTYLNSENVEKIELIGGEKYKADIAEMGSSEITEEEALTYDSHGRNTMIIKEKAQIDEILNACIYNTYSSMNQLNKIEGRINVTAYMRIESGENTGEKPEYSDKEETAYSAEYQTFQLYFDKDKIPEFVKKQLIAE